VRRLLPAFLLLLATGLIVLRRTAPDPAQKPRSLIVYCAAALKKPVEAIAAQFTAESGDEIHVQYGGTGTLLSSIRTIQAGDIFIAADTAAIEDGKRFGLLGEVLPILQQRPVLAVRKENPRQLRSMVELQRDGIRFAIANPESAAIGRLTRKLLGPAYPAFAQRATVTKPTVTEIASDLSLGSIDAAIVWDSTVAQFPNLESVKLPGISEHSEEASAAILTASKEPAAALRFARYLASPKQGGAIFSKMGFHPIQGDRKAE
jgi:molybdate transport system substrate-binding protein